MLQSKIQNKTGTPFYDPSISYQENYDFGPFGGILDEPSHEDLDALNLPEDQWANVGGLILRRPLGIPAGPLLNSKFTDAAFRWGFDLLHYKTVRSRFWPSHPTPNVLRVDAAHIPAGELGRYTLTAHRFGHDEQVDVETLSITNSFGMPAQQPDVWQADMEKAVRGAGRGQALVASLTGTQDLGGDDQAYIDDHARTAAMCVETGVHALEVNLSCPNLGGHGLLCHDPHAARLVCAAVKKAAGGLPLFAKLGSYSPDAQGEATLRHVIEATVPFLQGYSAVNAVPVPVSSAEGEQALPGAGRNVAGVCGAALKATGLDVVSRLARIRSEGKYDFFAIIGVGGLATPADYFAYLNAGADAVQGATGPMWNYSLAVKIALALKGTHVA